MTELQRNGNGEHTVVIGCRRRRVTFHFEGGRVYWHVYNANGHSREGESANLKQAQAITAKVEKLLQQLKAADNG